MRALVHRGPDPEPAPDEVLLRITATGICGSDLHGFALICTTVADARPREGTG